MLTITPDQARKRFTAIAPALKNAIFSMQTAEIIDQIVKDHNLSDERATKLAELVGWVLLGFVHPEDVAKELQDGVSVPSPTAEAVSRAVSAKIFSPLMDEFKTAYAPSPHEYEGESAPKIIQDIGPAATAGAGSQAAPPPAPLPGWSRETAAEPVVRLGQVAPPTPSAPPPMPKPPAPTLPKPATFPPAGTVDEFERLAKQRDEKTGPMPPRAAVPAPSAPKPPGVPEPPPVMLHHDTEFKAQPQAPGFHLELPEKPIDMRAGSSAPPPLRSAVLELGSVPPAAPKPGPMTTRVVHYSEYKSPSPERPVQPQSVQPQAAPAAQGPRHVTEITAQETPFAAPTKPPTPPAPAVRPMMPSSPTILPQAQPAPDKVIHKDYSAADTPAKPPQTQPPAPPVPPASPKP